MGLSASQARLLLLTAKNDDLELQAQLISNERLLLSQEQELIADEYSTATSNMIYECTVDSVEAKKDDGKMGTTKKGASLATIAQSCLTSKTSSSVSTYDADTKVANKDIKFTVKQKDGTTKTIEVKKGEYIFKEDYDSYKAAGAELNDADWKDSTAEKTAVQANASTQMVGFSYGGKTYFAQASLDPNAGTDANAYTMQYWVLDENGQMSSIPEDDSMITALNDSSPYGIVQRSLRNGTGELYMEVMDNQDENTNSNIVVNGPSGEKVQFVRKSSDSLSGVSSRYYTEDDAAAEAKYNGAMNRVNALDKKLENKLNQIETQKKAVETELESAESLIKSNVERTFKYFG